MRGEEGTGGNSSEAGVVPVIAEDACDQMFSALCLQCSVRAPLWWRWHLRRRHGCDGSVRDGVMSLTLWLLGTKLCSRGLMHTGDV